VVATAVGGIAEGVSDGVEGLLVPPGRPTDLADAVARVVADPSLRARFAEVAARRGDKFDVRHAVCRYEDCYRTVVSP
jgi:glycosyltransferase involved in cell wall biosynthesis